MSFPTSEPSLKHGNLRIAGIRYQPSIPLHYRRGTQRAHSPPITNFQTQGRFFKRLTNKMDHNCSFVYEASPLVVWPDKKTSARCLRSRWCSDSSPSPLLFDDDGLNNKEVHTAWGQRKSPSRATRAKRKNLFENGSEDELNQAVKVTSCAITTQTSLCKKITKDASTSMDKSPTEEILDAYLLEHPFLDLIGSCGGILILLVLIFYVYRWYTETVLSC